MRLWSVHPQHLDARGLVACWREGLLARAVLAGETRGYRHHPQLARFRAERDPLAALDAYLTCILDESIARGYSFDATKIRRRRPRTMKVTRGQLALEFAHLEEKLRTRDEAALARLRRARKRAHPCFRVVPGGVAEWERAPRA
jgi:hypothetical protein